MSVQGYVEKIIDKRAEIINIKTTDEDNKELLDIALEELKEAHEELESYLESNSVLKAIKTLKRIGYFHNQF